MCLQKWSFGFKLLHKVLIVGCVCEGYVTNNMCLFQLEDAAELGGSRNMLTLQCVFEDVPSKVVTWLEVFT